MKSPCFLHVPSDVKWQAIENPTMIDDFSRNLHLARGFFS